MSAKKEMKERKKKALDMKIEEAKNQNHTDINADKKDIPQTNSEQKNEEVIVDKKETPVVVKETKPEDLREEAIRKVEAILFASSRRMSASEIAAVLPELSLIEVSAALKHLQDYYNKAGTSMIVENNDNTWKLSLKKDYLPLVEKLMPSTELPRPVIEALAILAWKAPMMQSDLIKIRSLSAYDHVGELERIGLIRRNKKGRSFEVDLTEKFYEYFDLPKQAFQKVLEGYEDPVPQEKKESGPAETDDQRRERLIVEIRKNQINPEEIISKDKEYLHEFENRLKKIGEESNLIGGEVAKGKESLDKDLAEKANMNSTTNDTITQGDQVSENIEQNSTDEQKVEDNSVDDKKDKE